MSLQKPVSETLRVRAWVSNFLNGPVSESHANPQLQTNEGLDTARTDKKVG